ncbi:MAG TPA: YtxH domain-containing protein [Bacteroidetes bacterium]|nr:YtxH domain-containing protein [Candidatus Limimorpha avicola]
MSNRTKKTLLVLGVGLITGMAAGVILGVLYAPDKGVETRRRLKSQARDLEDKILDKFENVRNNERKEKSETRHNVAEVV